MNPIICEAIKNRNVLEFTYHGYPRVVEPHAYGLSQASNEVIRCYQTGGLSHSRIVPCWQLMKVDDIEFLTVREKHFVGERIGYVKGDVDMPTIFCEL